MSYDEEWYEGGIDLYERGDGSQFFICDLCLRKIEGGVDMYQSHIDRSCPEGNLWLR